MIESAREALVVGLGASGLSALRYLTRLGWKVTATDSNPERAGAAGRAWRSPRAALRGIAPRGLVVVSPGVPLASELLSAARERGAELVGDIELFARAVQAPVLAVTGTNGKSTVTALAAAMASGAGLRAVAGGNLGTPALDLLDSEAELYVLELSSFQLELTHSLAPLAAVVLNLSADHLDRHGSLAAYAAAKARIYARAGLAVVNRDDPRVMEMVAGRADVVSFGLGEPDEGDYGLRRDGDIDWLCRGATKLIAAAAVPLAGRHNLANVLAAWALAAAAGAPDAAAAAAVRRFHALPHRLAFVAEKRDVRYLDDSKATNVSAACATLEGLSGPLVVIAGGQGKGQDFEPFAGVLAKRARAVVLLGTDAPLIERALARRVPVAYATTMGEAVELAAGFARAGDQVILAPACASLDMYRDYNARGDAFVEAVGALHEY